jgi:hypothetical protein
MRLSQFSKNGISYLTVYLLSKPFKKGDKIDPLQALVLTFDPKMDDWQVISSRFNAEGDERYILIGNTESFEADILIDINKDGFQVDIVLDLQNVALRLYSGEKEKKNKIDKVEF